MQKKYSIAEAQRNLIAILREAERTGAVLITRREQVVARLISEREFQRLARREWPEAVRALAGAWPDLPSAEQIRKSEANDITRGRVSGVTCEAGPAKIGAHRFAVRRASD